MEDFVRIDREEYDHLMHMRDVARQHQVTLDMVMDVIQNNATTIDYKTLYLYSIDNPEQLMDIFRYRMPEDFRELQNAVIDRETRNDGD